MKVLVLGATGFIGFPIAQALVRAGYMVYGLARTADKAQKLAIEEIIPVQGDADSDGWIPLIATLDVVIDCLGAPGNESIGRQSFERIVTAVKSLRPAGAPLLNYIYTTGTWIHGDSRTAVVTDTTPIGPASGLEPIALTSWRPDFEQYIVNNKVVNGIIIRPALLYGRGGSLLAPLYQSASQGLISWPGTPGAIWTVIHVDDLADLYLRVAEKAPILRGLIFDGSNQTPVRADEFFKRLAEVSGATEVKYKTPTSKYEEALASSTIVRPYLGNALLGWTPKKSGLIEGLSVYYAAWLAAAKE